MADSAAAPVPVFELNNGRKLPSVGLGCWMGKAGGGKAVEDMVTNALRHGYRHIDTASGYANEEEVGNAIRASSIHRSDIFVTTKLPSQDHEPSKVLPALERSLAALNLDYVDLYLVHWPQAAVDGSYVQPDEFPTIVDTWKAMERLLLTGKVKSIGVSNFSVATLSRLLADCTVVPAVNQVELHPALPQHELAEFCKQKGIHLTAYTPIGRADSPFLSDKSMLALAKKYKADVGRVVLSWGVLRGTSVIPKSANENRMRGNINVSKLLYSLYDRLIEDNAKLLELDAKDVDTLDMWHQTSAGRHTSLVKYLAWKDGLLLGWTLEQLGWSYNLSV